MAVLRVRQAQLLIARVQDLHPQIQQVALVPRPPEEIRQCHRAQVGSGAALVDPVVGVPPGLRVRLIDLRAVQQPDRRQFPDQPGGPIAVAQQGEREQAQHEQCRAAYCVQIGELVEGLDHNGRGRHDQRHDTVDIEPDPGHEPRHHRVLPRSSAPRIGGRPDTAQRTGAPGCGVT
ncbi:hypothetical protein [Nocardia sp. NPDC059239]|uniref:hypothetical protein n=1 Tax=unclassified Nocardia TaxID=2637762 RepID=UPI0036C6945F